MVTKKKPWSCQFEKYQIECFNPPYHPLLRRPKFVSGHINAIPNNAGFKMLENQREILSANHPVKKLSSLANDMTDFEHRRSFFLLEMAPFNSGPINSGSY